MGRSQGLCIFVALSLFPWVALWVSGECWGEDRECEFSCASGIVCVCAYMHTLVLTQELIRILGSLGVRRLPRWCSGKESVCQCRRH